MRLIGMALAPVALLLLACAGEKPDIFTGYYINADKGMRISRTAPDQFLIILRDRSGEETALLTGRVRNRLKSLANDGYAVVRDSGVDYSLETSLARLRLQKTDSLGFAVWWKSTLEWNPLSPDSAQTMAPAPN